MRANRSAGILVFRRPGRGVEVLLAHPGGPFWKVKSDGVWSIPKGEFDPHQESPIDAARREFLEELGHPIPDGEVIELGEVTQKGGKTVVAFAVEGDLDPATVVSNTFTMEWPPQSGRTATFPEIDRVEWFTVDAARGAINSAQTGFLDRLVEALGRR
jgi:predicted NUDIX family NTP pyrophosphohydrolase